MTFVHFARAKKNNTSFYEKIDVIKMSQLLKILRLIPCCCCCCFFSFFPHSLRIFCMNGSRMGKKVRLSDENFFREHSRGSLTLSHIKPWILFSVQEGFISRAKKRSVCVYVYVYERCKRLNFSQFLHLFFSSHTKSGHNCK